MLKAAPVPVFLVVIWLVTLRLLFSNDAVAVASLVIYFRF